MLLILAICTLEVDCVATTVRSRVENLLLMLLLLLVHLHEAFRDEGLLRQQSVGYKVLLEMMLGVLGKAKCSGRVAEH